MQQISPQVRRPGLLGALAAALAAAALMACLGLIGLASALEARVGVGPVKARAEPMPVQKEVGGVRRVIKANGG